MLGRRVLLAGVVVAGLLGTSLVYGDDAKPAKADAKPEVKGTLPAHFKQLGLSQEQQDKVTSIHADYKAKIDALTKELKELRDKQHEEVAKILTEEQKEHLKKILAANALGTGANAIKKTVPARAVSDGDEKKTEKKEDKKQEKK